jgi:large subunit ribosomal protein L28
LIFWCRTKQEEDKWIKLMVSAHGIRIINKKGISQALKDAAAKGYYKA